MFATWREGFSMVPLVLVLTAVIVAFGANLAGPGIDDLLHPWSLQWQFWPVQYIRPWGIEGPLLPGIELTIVPLAAIVAPRLRLGAERIRSLHKGKIRLFLPLLMTTSLVGLTAYLVWSWGLPQAELGPDEFGVVRWLGVALLGAFTWFWLPAFPRVTAKLAGMIGGPALFAAAGYLLFSDAFKNEPGYSEISTVFTAFAVLLAIIAEPLMLISGRLWLSSSAHAALTGASMIGLSYVGTLVYVCCG